MHEPYLHHELTEKIIGLAMEVHRNLGPGFIEAVYEEALIYELTAAGLACEKQKEFTIQYKDIVLAKKLRCDLIVENNIIVENKAVAEIVPIDEVQLVSYLKASRLQVGLLFNFGKKSLQFKRRVLTLKKSA
ncbi:MAG: GxxExxY protein [Thermodesulfobacteriota bacterium]